MDNVPQDARVLDAPELGQIVRFHLRPGTGTNGRDYVPALVTKVWSGTCVDLTVYPDFAQPFRIKEVHRHFGIMPSNGKEWSW